MKGKITKDNYCHITLTSMDLQNRERPLNLAIYLDFENLAISADQAFSHIDRPLELSPILDIFLSKGVLCIKRAFADWNKPDCQRYVRNLNKFGFDLIYLPNTSSSGKNGADIQMVIDILEDLQFSPIVDAIVIGSGDTDFLPVIKRIIARGKPVYIIGFDDSVGDVIRENCTEYFSLNTILSQIHKPNPDDKELLHDPDYQQELYLEGRNLLIRYIRSSNPEDPVLLSKLKLDLLRLDSSFTETNYGSKSFTKFVDSYVGDVIKERKESESGHPQVVFKSRDEISQKEENKSISPINSFISKKLKLQIDKKIRLLFAKQLLECFKENPSISMNGMASYIYERSDNVSKGIIQKYVFTLGQGRVFHYSNKEYQGSLYDRPQIINPDIVNPKQIEEIYHERIKELIRNRFSDVDLNSIHAYKLAFE